MDLSFRTLNLQGKKFKTPNLLKKTHSKMVQKAINHFEENLGNKEEKLNRHYIMDLFPKRKIGKGLMKVLKKWYYSVKGLPDTGKTSPSDWRIRYYQYLMEERIGWVSPDDLNNYLEKFAESMGVSKDKELISNLMFADHKVNFHIRRKETDFNPEDVIKRYNTDVVKYIFSRSLRMWFEINNINLSGELVKSIIRNSKLWGIFTDITKKGDLIRIETIGPNELVGRQIKYGRLLYALFHSIIDILPKNQKIFVEMEYRKRIIPIVITLGSFESLLPLNLAFNQSINSSFDSKIEAEFKRKFKLEMPHWSIKSEEVLIEDDVIFIPDFVLKYRDVKLYLEIVGFWTDKYIEKKVQKLNKFMKTYENRIILMIDKKLDFPTIGLPSFYYSNTLNLSKLRNYLAKNYGNEAFRVHLDNLKKKKNKIENKICQLLASKNYLDYRELKNVFATYSEEKTKQALLEIFPNDYSTRSIQILSNYGIVFDKSYFDDVVTQLSSIIPKDGIPEHKLRDKVNVNITILSILLNHLGYIQKYYTLDDILIIPPIKSDK